MAKIRPNASQLIDTYLTKKEPFANEINTKLRELIHAADPNIVEDYKWGMPVFHKNEMIMGFAGFKKHVSVMFFNGAQMKDSAKLFTDDCSAQFSRTAKFSSVDEIKDDVLIAYFREAISLTEVPKSKSPKKTKETFEVPELLQNALNENAQAKENYEKMAYTYRKEYAKHISDAKQEKTKLRRLEKVIYNLERNIKMHEQYK